MKDDEHFPSATVALERYEISQGKTSLAVTRIVEASQAREEDAGALSVLETKFGSNGATHGEWAMQFERDIGR